jgi:mRNA-degrading endonuclease toxin of MazEF toxin-antitoxin module
VGRADHQLPTASAHVRVSAANELLRGSVWSFRYLDDDEPKPVVIVSNDGRNRSRFEWVHVVRITTRPKRSLPTIVELSDRDAPLTGRAMADELELVHQADLEDRRGMLSPSTMAAIDSALRNVLALQ